METNETRKGKYNKIKKKEKIDYKKVERKQREKQRFIFYSNGKIYIFKNK